MPKTASYLICILVVTSPGFAQRSISFHVGANIANLSNPGNLVSSATWYSRVGIVGGVSVTFPVSTNLAVEPGFRFVQKGTKSKWSYLSKDDVQSTLTNSYLELPVYLKYQLADFGSRLWVQGGPTISYLLSSWAKGTMSSFGEFSFDVIDDYRRYDASLDFGIVLDNPLSSDWELSLGALYSLGLVKINKSDSNEKTRDIRLMVGISYLLD